MAGRKSDFTLTKLDDLFTTQAQRDEEQLSKIRDIPLELIDDFPDHPFKVRDDEDMMQLVESVKERGVITPATVRQKVDGRYELVSGHRRKYHYHSDCHRHIRSNLILITGVLAILKYRNHGVPAKVAIIRNKVLVNDLFNFQAKRLPFLLSGMNPFTHLDKGV